MKISYFLAVVLSLWVFAAQAEITRATFTTAIQGREPVDRSRNWAVIIPPFIFLLKLRG